MGSGEIDNSVKPSISIIIPAKNEAAGLKTVLPRLRELYPDAELIVVDDGSSDDTRAVAGEYASTVVHHPQSMGNGAAIKAGARRASGDIIVTMDGDGQHRPEDIELLVNPILDDELDMVVGARQSQDHAGHHRFLANSFYNLVASKFTGFPIKDLTSGMRACKSEHFRQFLFLFPNGFSYPTTVTMAFLKVGYRLGYRTISVKERLGNSHISLFKDGAKFAIIIFKMAFLYSPLKLFLPISAFFFGVASLKYASTFPTGAQLTNPVLFTYTFSLVLFLLGFVSEQITNLYYKR